jgi:hypothetical protein
MKDVRSWILVGGMVCGGVAGAKPGEMRDEEVFELLDAASTGRSCLAKGGVCATAGAAQTAAVEGTAVASVGKRGAAAPAPAFARAAPGQAWTLELDARLSRPAVQGNTLFLFYDMSDPESIAAHEVTMLQQRSVPPGKAVAARVRLTPEDGFVAGHSYRVQVVQLIGGKELVLAQGDFALK